MASERIQRRVERLLDQIEQEADQQNWQLVRDLADEVLGLYPDNGDALAFLSASERRLSSTLDGEVEQVISPEPTTPAAGGPEAERRQLTVMFCDIQDSTALSQQLDPEELRNVIRSYQEVCADAVSRFEGHIAKYLGDGLLVYFGYPQAHEDDPERAARAGLAIVENMATLNTRLRGDKNLQLTIRLGVHTGLVVAREMGGGETVEPMAIVGETPNIAARLQEVADHNALVISDSTRRLIEGFFLCEPLGSHTLKGISHPMELFRVVAESGAQTRFDVAAATRLTPLVGREQEVGLLLDRWEQVKEGRGQAVLLSGEAGIGKSRLIESLSERLTEEPHTLRQLRCSAYHQNSALYPVVGFLERLLGFGREDSDEDRLLKLDRALADVDFPLAESVPLLAALLSIQTHDRFPPLALSPEVQRETTLGLLVALLLASANEQPVFIVVEDLHWADPSTLAMLEFLLDQAPTVQVLAVFSYRPEFSPPWEGRGYITHIMLNRLTRRLTAEMIGRLAGSKSLPPEVLDQIASKCDGVPLFVEELTQMVIESDLLRELDEHYELFGSLEPLAIPSTLQDSLTARLDRLASVREVAQLGAVLGREFSYRLLQAVTPLEETTLQTHLQQLISSELLFQRGVPPDATYTFKHALVQDAAYESLLKSSRQQYHRQVAIVMVERFPDILETQPELVAHHYTEAGLNDQAIPFCQRAGERALITHAHEEALAHFQRGLAAKEERPMDAETAALLFGLGRAQGATDLVREAWVTLSRAFDYYLELGDIPRIVDVAKYPLLFTSGISQATSLVERALMVVPGDSLEAGYLLSRHGMLLMLESNDYEGAERAFSGAMAIANNANDLTLETLTLVNSADADWYQMRGPEVLKKSLRAIELVHHNNDPSTHAWSHFLAAFELLASGDPISANRFAQEMLARGESLRDRGVLAQACLINMLVTRLTGDWAPARDFCDRGLALEPQNTWLLGLRAVLESEVGEIGRSEAYMNRLLACMRKTAPGPNQEHLATAWAIPVIARITEDSVWFDIAEEAAQAVLTSPECTLRMASLRFAQALVSVQENDIVTAAQQYWYLVEVRDKVTPGDALTCGLTGADRVLGLLAQTMRNLDQATLHFEDALAFCRKAGYRPERAWTCCDYADTLRERDAEGDRPKAIALLDESLAISSELGMRPLMERVLSRREILKA